MDKSDYVRLLKESSINDETKFKPVSAERPKMRGRPPKHFHPLLEKEKELTAALKEFFPKILLIPLFKKVQDLPTCTEDSQETTGDAPHTIRDRYI